MSLNLLRRRFASFAVLGVLGIACGARSQLDPCQRDSDCIGSDLCSTFACQFDDKLHTKACVLVKKTNCDDGNACTTDSCDGKTGLCKNEFVTFDLDGDGHHQPLPGFQPGAPGSCGDDCDDTDPRAFPGNKEVCDGVDNDCDGIIDNGATYTPAGGDFQLSKPTFDWAEPMTLTRGSATGNVRILATYGASLAGQFSPFVQPLDATGKPTIDPNVLTATVAAGGDTSVAWTGDRYGIAWSDRRDGNFEIYFATLDADGKKLAPGDERITVSPGFSLYPSLVWTGQQFVMVWQEEKANGDFKIEGQRINLTGQLIGDITVLTSGSFNDQGPALAHGSTELGLVWVRDNGPSQSIVYQPFATDLTGLSAVPKPVTLTSATISGEAPSIAYDHKNDRYVVSFSDPSAAKRTIYGAVVGKDGSVVDPAKDVSQSPAQARESSMIAFGDRVLFVYGDDRDQNSGYELYAHVLSADLSTELAPPVRVTNATGDSIEPVLSFAADGTVLIIFRDDRGTNPAVWETGLSCVMPP